MNQIPNFIIVLDFSQKRIVRIQLSEEEKRLAASCDDLEECVDVLSEQYHFSLINSQWMALNDYKEDSYGFTK